MVITPQETPEQRDCFPVTEF